jgi:hypothetical protein
MPMLVPSKVIAALETRRESFVHHEDTFHATIVAYQAALADLRSRFPTGADLAAMLDGSQANSGAHPLALYDVWAATGEALPIERFGETFAHHEAARAWAERAIGGVTTVAVDGSQVLPWREGSFPVALAQVGIFVNPHDAARPYMKDVRVEILGPAELTAPEDMAEDEKMQDAFLTEKVHLRRFEMETAALAEWMRVWRPGAGDATPLALLDGSLIVSFAQSMPQVLRDAYIKAATSLLDASQEARIPLLAYIDTSFARDLVTMLRAAMPDRGLPSARRLHDALLWGDDLAWGDATMPFGVRRKDVLKSYGAHSDAIAFVSLRAAADRPPARVEMPRWMVDSGEYRWALQCLRAELIAGNGYPYAIETADAVAVISQGDRAHFLQIVQRFAEDAGVPFTVSHKAVSKSRRR